MARLTSRRSSESRRRVRPQPGASAAEQCPAEERRPSAILGQVTNEPSPSRLLRGDAVRLTPFVLVIPISRALVAAPPRTNGGKPEQVVQPDRRADRHFAQGVARDEVPLQSVAQPGRRRRCQSLQDVLWHRDTGESTRQEKCPEARARCPARDCHASKPVPREVAQTGGDRNQAERPPGAK